MTAFFEPIKFRLIVQTWLLGNAELNKYCNISVMFMRLKLWQLQYIIQTQLLIIHPFEAAKMTTIISHHKLIKLIRN